MVQGQTSPKTIVDIVNENLNEIYVALSRNRGRHTIRILRPFEKEKLQKRQPQELLEEDERLDLNDGKTRILWEKQKTIIESSTTLHSAFAKIVLYLYSQLL